MVIEMRIKCSTVAEFVEVIKGLVMNGLLFDADATTLSIELTGGY